MNRLAPLAFALAVALPAPALAADVGVPPPTPAGAVLDVAVVTATVAAIDLDKREVTLKGEDGQVVTLTVGEEARNLPQVKVGDVVTFEYYQALAVALEPTTTAIRAKVEHEEVGRAPPGARPAGYVEKTVDVTGSVQAIDTKTRTVTLRGPERVLTLHVEDDVDLSRIQVGQTVLARYIEGFAISVAAPGKK
jgi:Cu/Ag efflux protein CusF